MSGIMNKKTVTAKRLCQKLVWALFLGTLVFTPSAKADPDVSTYIKPSYGEGDGVLEITVDGVTTEIHYKNSFGEGDATLEETYETPIGDIEVTFDYPTEPLNSPIVNHDVIDTITGNYENNNGCIIDNYWTINSINDSNFVNNTADYSAIYNDSFVGKIGEIKESFFVNNTVNDYYAGAIYNSGVIEKISDSVFMSNSVHSAGGAIYNDNTDGIKNIEKTIFIGNTADNGGAICNSGKIGKISQSDFVANSTIYGGGAIRNERATIEDIEQVKFIGNSTKQEGGAIDNSGQITNIKDSDFIGNSAGYGGAIYGESGSITNINNVNFIANKATKNGGAIDNERTIGEITKSLFAGNSAEYGGAIYNHNTRSVVEIGSVNNSVFEGNTASVNGGAIANVDKGAIREMTNNVFINNHANSNGGAIYSVNDLVITSDNGTTIFKGNTAGDDDNAIYLDNASGTITFNIKEGGKTYMYDNVRGADGYSVKMTGDDKETATMHLYNDLHGAKVTADNLTLNTINNDIHTYEFNSFTLDSDINMSVDVDLKNESMDRIQSDNVDVGDYAINIVGMNLLSDATKDQTSILFADNNLKDSVENKVSQIGVDTSNEYQTVAYSPIYKYDVKYDATGDEGYFVFNRTGGGDHKDYNPSVLAQPVTTQANVAMVNSLMNNYAFHSVDTSNITRLSSKYQNRYAMTNPVSDDVNTNNPLFIEPKDRGVWFKPFVTFENLPLRNGPKVRSINYGALIGYDSQPINMKNGFDGVITGYVGYTGSSMHYSGIDEYSNGGLLGGTFSLYKGKFFNATTVMVGAMGNQANTKSGRDNMATLYTAVGDKIGYNFEFKDGLFVLQPSMLISYTFANTFDYTNSAGVHIHSKPVNSIQLSPGIKFYMNLKNGWRPYIGVNMMWNLLDKTNVTANNVSLPSMSIKPYVEYGLGLQKDMTDNFSAYAQAMVQNGGRNGVSLTGGMKYLFSN